MNPDEAQLIAQTVDTSANIEAQILRIACYDEYRANAYYQKVIDTYGAVTPFNNIVQAEIRHYSILENLCQKYGVTPPVNDWYEKIQVGATLAECCEDGVKAEIANIEMYNNLLEYVVFDDIRDAFYREQAASYNNHLPAFTQCTQTYQASQQQTAQQEGSSPQHHDIYNMVQGLMNGEMDTVKLTQTLTSLASRDVMLGMAAGAALTMALTSDASKEILNNLLKGEENNNEKDKS